MGAYAECWVDNFHLGDSKNDVNPDLMQLYRASDRQDFSGMKSDLPKCIAHRWAEDLADDEKIEVVYYSAPARIIKERLNLIGYSLQNSINIFDRCRRGELEEKEKYDLDDGLWDSDIEVLKAMTAKKWISIMKEFHKSRLKLPRFYKKVEQDGSLSTYCKNNAWYGFPGPDTTAAIRLMLEIIPDQSDLVYDVTELISAGYFNLEDDLVALCRENVSSDHQSHSKVIVLTEGKFDSFVLSKAINILFPHLFDYFSFLDYESSRVGGGAGSLANMVKSFAGAGIVNKVLAIFDNDTAAHAALRALRHVTLPSNIQCITLPRTELLNNYPTLGPSGLVDMDINGMAASIETFLGANNLKDGNGEFYPIQWTGYEPSLEKYQGEITNKKLVQKNFREQLSKIDNSEAKPDDFDWEDIKTVLDVIFKAFNPHSIKQYDSWLERYYN